MRPVRARRCVSPVAHRFSSSASSTQAPAARARSRALRSARRGRLHAASSRIAVQARRLAERALLRAGRHPGPRCLVRAVRAPAAAPRRPSRAGRAADQHLAGLQLPRRGLLVLRLERPRDRPLPAADRRRRPASLPRLRPGLHPLARAPPQACRLRLRRRPRPGRVSGGAGARLRPGRLLRPRGVRDDARVRPDRRATATSAATSRSSPPTTSSTR